MKELWDKRYSADEFVYGKEPNQFFKDTIDSLELTGQILLPAEGEGRNAVYAAKRGLSVYGFDISSNAKKKAVPIHLLIRNKLYNVALVGGNFLAAA